MPAVSAGKGGNAMKRRKGGLIVVALLLFVVACGTMYKAKPVPFKSPASYPNATEVAGATVASQAYSDPKKAEEAFGFNIRGAGMLPVQVVFDNMGSHTLKIHPGQTFLEDDVGNLWPILTDQFAYERATKYAQTNQIFKEGAYAGFLGGAAGAIVGAAIGIVTGTNVAAAAGQGAAVGAAGGAVLGGAKGYTSDDATRAITNDLNQKRLENRDVFPKMLAYGFLFFPGEASSAKQLRLQLMETDTGKVHVVKFNF
jgi:hypothetical protein